MGLVIDKLTGNVYLFDINGGGGGTGATSPYSEVNMYAQLPIASDNNGKIYVVRQSSGTYMINRKEAGLYYSNGVNWTRLGDIPAFFNDDNFKIYDGTDNSKEIRFQLSGLTSGGQRTIIVRDTDGTIAYLSDLEAFSATTDIRLSNIEAILSTLTGNTGGTVSLPQAIQLIDLLGTIDVNMVSPVAILWSSAQFSGTSLSYTGGSRIYIQEDGKYEITYNLVLKNGTNNSKTIGTVVRVNNALEITPLSIASFIDSGTSITGSNSVGNYKRQFNAGDYVQLYGFRVGSSGSVTTIGGASWIRIVKIN